MKKYLFAIALFMACVGLISCSSYSAPTSGSGGGGSAPSKIAFRAFVSNPVQTLNGFNVPVLNIVDANMDLISPLGGVPLSGSITDPQRMILTPDHVSTLVYSPADNALAVVTNAKETVNTSSSPSGSATIKFSALTESIVLAPVGTLGYAAEPTASVVGQSSGAVQAFDYNAQIVFATVPLPAAHFLAETADGTHLLVFSDNSNSVTVVSTPLIGTASNPLTSIAGFDHPVGAVFLSNSTAAVFNCGAECGGTSASVSVVNILTGTITATIPVRGATAGLLASDNNTLYVVGTPPGTACGSGTQAQSCGTLDVVNLSAQTATSAPNLITDGYHNLLKMGANGQLFIGARTCTNFTATNNSAGEVRGCLSIYNTSTGAVTIPPASGDVTGIQPITGRNVVYLCQGGMLQIYDTTTDALQATQVSIVGQAFDVVLVDTPSSTN